MLKLIDEVATELRVSPYTVQRWIRQGKVKAIKLPGGCYRIEGDELDRILAQKTDDSTDQLLPPQGEQV